MPLRAHTEQSRLVQPRQAPTVTYKTGSRYMYHGVSYYDAPKSHILWCSHDKSSLVKRCTAQRKLKLGMAASSSDENIGLRPAPFFLRAVMTSCYSQQSPSWQLRPCDCCPILSYRTTWDALRVQSCKLCVSVLSQAHDACTQEQTGAYHTFKSRWMERVVM